MKCFFIPGLSTPQKSKKKIANLPAQDYASKTSHHQLRHY